MLKGVAGFLECSLRSTDAVFRIGGEEFLLILPGADSDEARLRLEAIRRELADTALATRIGELRVTLSAGLAVWPDQGRASTSCCRWPTPRSTRPSAAAATRSAPWPGWSSEPALNQLAFAASDDSACRPDGLRRL